MLQELLMLDVHNCRQKVLKKKNDGLGSIGKMQTVFTQVYGSIDNYGQWLN